MWSDVLLRPHNITAKRICEEKGKKSNRSYTYEMSGVIARANFTRQDTKWKNKTAAASWEYGNIGRAISKKIGYKHVNGRQNSRVSKMAYIYIYIYTHTHTHTHIHTLPKDTETWYDSKMGGKMSFRTCKHQNWLVAQNNSVEDNYNNNYYYHLHNHRPYHHLYAGHLHFLPVTNHVSRVRSVSSVL